VAQHLLLVRPGPLASPAAAAHHREHLHQAMSLFSIRFYVTGAVALMGASLAAQTTSTAPETGSEVTELEKFTVTDVPVGEQILPTVRPVGSVLGDNMSVIDLPRAVTTVNQAWMQDRHVENAMDFGQFSPGVYSPARYGVPATPQIRGDNAQIYINGQQTLYTAESIYPSFNGVEAMDIVKGPGSAIYGPQSQAPGGYVNLVTKAPYFDRTQGEVESTIGSWTSGHSYFNPEFTVDLGGPISSDVAYRVSYLSRYGNYYYQNDPNRTQDIFLALTARPTSKLTFEWWGQWYGSLFEDITGQNRPTQAFIDHGTYVGGSVIAFPDTPPFGAGAVDGSYGVLDPTTAYLTKLAANKVLTVPGDSARTGRWQTQLITTYDTKNNSKIVNRTYLESANDRELNQWGYNEYMPVQESAQDRLEYHGLFGQGWLTNSLIAGGDFRYTRIVAYQDYAIEPFFFYDLNKPSSTFHFPAYAADGNTFGGGYAVPGAPGYSAYLPGDSSNQDSHIYDSAGFIQDDVGLGKYFSTVIGFRDDHIKADDGNPNLIQVMDPTTGTVFNPGVPVHQGSIYYATGSVNDPSYFASVSFKPTSTQTFYVSYNRVNSIQGSANFGGVNVSLLSSANFPTGTPSDYQQQLSSSLKTSSTLYETGYKGSFLGNTLYLGATLYQQIKTEPQIRGAPNFLVKSNGIELEAVYQPSKALTVNGNFTYQTVTDYGTSFFQQTNNYLDGYPAGFMVDGQSGTGDGSPNFSAVPENGFSGFYSPPGGRMKAPGVPQVLANVFVQYEFPCGFGIGAGPQIQGPEYANDQDTLHIPGEYELDGYLFFRKPTWDVQINVKNITNQRLLDPVDVTFAGNDAIYVRPPISASITVRYRF
jgi:iron complex outermembrane receptor protein